MRPARGLVLDRVLLGHVAHGLEIRLLLELDGAVVDAHLPVQGEHVALLRHDERVDLEERAVLLDEHLRHGQDHLVELLERLPRQAERVGHAPRLVALEAETHVPVLLDDGLRILLGHLLDLHAALRGGHEHRLPRLAVEDGAQVELAADVAAGLDVDAPDDAAVRAGLLGDERESENLRRDVLRFGGALHELDAALEPDRLEVLLVDGALPAAAGVDLGLHDRDGTLELREGLAGLIGAFRDEALGDGNAVLTKDFLRLKLVEIHWCSPFSARARAGFRPSCWAW